MSPPRPYLTAEDQARQPKLGSRALLITAGLALLFAGAGEYAHHRRLASERCLLDRLPIQVIYRTTVNHPDGRSWLFGSPRCALTWLEQQQPRERNLEVLVTDEVTGRVFPAAQAFFVESEVVTSRQDGNRLHVFADEIEARRHAQKYQGQLGTNPFVPWELVRTRPPQDPATPDAAGAAP